MRKSRHRLIYDGSSFGMFHYLWQIADPAIRRSVYLTGRRGLYIAYQFKNGAFTRAVLADKPYLVFFAYMETYVVQQCKTAIRYRYVID